MKSNSRLYISGAVDLTDDNGNVLIRLHPGSNYILLYHGSGEYDRADYLMTEEEFAEFNRLLEDYQNNRFLELLVSIHERLTKIAGG